MEINKSFVLAVYLLLILYFLHSTWMEILSSEYFLLLLALVLFGASSFLDIHPLDSSEFPHLADLLRTLYLPEDHRFECRDLNAE